MKKQIHILLIILPAIIACNQPVKGRNGVTYKSAVQYNAYIIDRQKILIKGIINFGKAARINMDSASWLLDSFAIRIENMIRDIKEMPPYKGDSSLRDAMLGSFIFYKRCFQHDYKEIIRIRQSGENNTEQGEAAVNRIVNGLSKEEEKFDKALHTAQKNFAGKNKMKLKENEMQKKIDESD